MKRTKYEQETIIYLNAEDSSAEVYTCDPVWLRKMDSLCKRQPKQFQCTKEHDGAKWYWVEDKKRVNVTIKKAVSEASKKASSERMKKLQGEGKLRDLV